MKKLIILFSVCIFLFSSCNNLDLFPLSEGSSENWFSDKTELEMSVANLFDSHVWEGNDDFGYGDYTFYWNTDDFSRRNSLTGITNATINGESGYVKSTWQLAYKCIASANLLLENIEKANDVPEKKLNEYSGNAKFARASQYAKLIFLYGDVPYYEKSLNIEEAFTLGRTDKDAVLDKIYADYDYAIENLPLSYSSSEFQFATKGAALAMKARIALLMGDYTIARDAALACINLGVYQLYPNFSTLFISATKNSVETIFAIPHSVELKAPLLTTKVKNVVTRTAGGFGSDYPSWDLFCSFLCADGLPIDESPLFNPREPFKNRDPRCSATIVEFGREWLGYTYTPHPDSLKVMKFSTGKMVTNNDNLANTQFASYNGLYWAKKVDEDWIDTYADNDNIIIRYADVLLMYAEAKIELGEIDNTVLEAMNKVRARAYGVNYTETSSYPTVVMTNQSELRKVLRIERRMEFAMENNLRYNDIIRWRLAEKVLNIPDYGLLNAVDLRAKIVKPGLWFFPYTPTTDEDGVADFSPMYNAGLVKLSARRTFNASRQYLWPIPSKEILINDNLTQNSGY